MLGTYYHSYKAHQHEELHHVENPIKNPCLWRKQIRTKLPVEREKEGKINQFLQYLQYPRREISNLSWLDQYCWTYPFAYSGISLTGYSGGSRITMVIQGFDGLSTCLFTESFTV